MPKERELTANPGGQCSRGKSRQLQGKTDVFWWPEMVATQSYRWRKSSSNINSKKIIAAAMNDDREEGSRGEEIVLSMMAERRGEGGGVGGDLW